MSPSNHACPCLKSWTSSVVVLILFYLRFNYQFLAISIFSMHIYMYEDIFVLWFPYMTCRQYWNSTLQLHKKLVFRLFYYIRARCFWTETISIRLILKQGCSDKIIFVILNFKISSKRSVFVDILACVVFILWNTLSVHWFSRKPYWLVGLGFSIQ